MNQETASAQIPTWITELEREKAAREHSANEISQQQIKATMLVQQQGPTFWQELLERLKDNTDALPRLGGELYGSTSPMGGDKLSAELSCRIQVDRRSVRLGPNLSHMDLFFQPGGARIRRWYQDRPLSDLELQLGAKGIVATIEGGHPMTSQELADYIVRRMAENVRH